jgi:N-acetylglucosamine kinase-like BadF-type ATPase
VNRKIEMHMILVADSGSTKTDWALIDNDKCIYNVQTKGMNPFFQTEKQIEEEIKLSLLSHLPEGAKVEAVYFYGAGCTFEKAPLVERAIANAMPDVHQIEANSDMLGAARALCGRNAGIACILGTGSNSCLYNGDKILANVSPLGYVLGDEGSGAVLGKLFVGSLLKNRMTEGLKERFMEETNLDSPTIVDKVYRQPFPNRFLAGLAPFLSRHIEDPSVHDLVSSSFSDFFVRNVAQYEGYTSLPIHFTGSVAFYFKDVLKKVTEEMGLCLGKIEKSPIEGLVKFHVNK